VISQFVALAIGIVLGIIAYGAWQRLLQPGDGGDADAAGAVNPPPDAATYQAAALRTEHTPDFINPAFFGGDVAHAKKIARLLHALLGLASETGEIADQLKKHLIYGKPLDEVNLVEEHGDFSWYANVMIDAVDSTWEVSWAKNIAKLKVRFPDKFTQAQALTRDLDAERAALETP
jgi:NTP pyrophosphatase (non-canonical NTP hydrolase)